jgi:Peptidase family M28
MEVIGELCSFEGRLAGTDAERRAANRVAERLREQGRRVEVESTYVHPQIGLILAAHCLLGIAGSIVGVASPEVGFACVLVAATSLYLDLNTRFYILRRLFFRRASQNVVARAPASKADARLLLCAHVDTARTGIIYKPGRLQRIVRLGRALRLELTPPRLIFWSLAVLIPVLGVQAAGVDSRLLSLLQLLPTLVLLIAVFGLVELELSDVVPGANDNASGVATVLSLAEELDRKRPRNLDVWVVITGGEECLFEGMRSFLRRHRKDLDPKTTWIVNVDSVGRGDVRYATSEGLAVGYSYSSRLTQIFEAIAEADQEAERRYRASGISHGFATDALAARVRKLRATTITCVEPGAVVPANYHLPTDTPAAIDPKAVERAHDFTLAAIHALDADLGRSR